MKRTYCVAVILVLSMIVNISAQTTADEAILKHISGQTKQHFTHEFTEDRKIMYGDLDGDADEDAVVLYKISDFNRGNNFGQYLAVFINHKGIYKLATEEVMGSKLAQYISTLKSVNRKNIYLETESCSKPLRKICKNPKRGNLIISFRNGKLVKVGGSSQKYPF